MVPMTVGTSISTGQLRMKREADVPDLPLRLGLFHLLHQLIVGDNASPGFMGDHMQ